MIRAVIQSFAAECKARGPKKNFVFDVGMNEGYYSLLVAAHGCRSYGFEPQPECVMKIHFALGINDLAGSVKVHNNIVSNSAATIQVPTHGCDGEARYADKFRGHNPARGPMSPISSLSLDDVLPADVEEVVMMHIDTEGAEVNVLTSALKMIEAKKVLNIIVEVTPTRVAEIAKATGQPAPDVTAFLRKIKAAGGYYCRNLTNSNLKDPLMKLKEEERFAHIAKWPEFDFGLRWGQDIWCTRDPRYMSS
eukprot:TRINITY_DN385_c0_g1_i2.p1 TRINITY_DN385_c0_g1~~TRINITY_DN385_c0_g1_i2.p1  ORF type:complete len:250 (-),score=20.07 TRINITY_DN385_c0_g1_i2:520-1269(-)